MSRPTSHTSYGPFELDNENTWPEKDCQLDVVWDEDGINVKGILNSNRLIQKNKMINPKNVIMWRYISRDRSS